MTRTDSVKNIIFDLGGVLLNIEPKLTGLALEQMGVKNMALVHARLTESGLYARYDQGACSDSRFREEIRQACGIELTDGQIDEAWNALLLDFPPGRVEMMHSLAGHYRLFLLSNTNSIHYLSYTSRFREVHGEPLTRLFEKLFLSFEMGCHKPDPQIYTLALQQGNLAASETLFIDDSLANAEGAVRQGLSAIHLAPGMEVTDLFKQGLLREDVKVLFPS